MDEQLKAAWAELREAERTVEGIAEQLSAAKEEAKRCRANYYELMDDAAAGQARMFGDTVKLDDAMGKRGGGGKN